MRFSNFSSSIECFLPQKLITQDILELQVYPITV